MSVAMMGLRVCWLVIVVCFSLTSQRIGADDVDERNKHNLSAQKSGATAKRIGSCAQLCQSLHEKNGCQYAPKDNPREEVIVVTNGDSDIRAWQWETITMVVASHMSSKRNTGLSACVTHSKGKRFGLKEVVPDASETIANVEQEKSEFALKITTYQKLLMADHMVFDLLDFFANLKSNKSLNQSLAMSKMTEVLKNATQTVLELHRSDVYCMVPWQPPCDSDCSEFRALLRHCHVLLLSPDSYIPTASANKQCEAQATVPISQFLYGIDRYLSLKIQANVQSSIVAGIPWHGYAYSCNSLDKTTNKCSVTKNEGEKCFDEKNRQRMSLGHIHSDMNIPDAHVKIDDINKGLYYNLNDTAQLWYENFTTLYIKYQLVNDLGLRGLSIWYGEDMLYGLSADKTTFSINNWNFLMLHVLHKAVTSPQKTSHYYADTVAGVGVGCLLLGTALGVTFTCIAFRRNSYRRRNRPFKLDETDDDFRDDEGL